MNILCIIDTPKWAFHRNCLALQRYGKNTYNIRFGKNDKYKNAFHQLKKYDLILYWTDVRPNYLVKHNPPRSKTIMMIRSDVFKTCKPKQLQYFKESKLMTKHVKAFMTANRYLTQVFKSKYGNKTYYAPGGVDTEIFKPRGERKIFKPCRVGWAGSKKNFGSTARGLGIIQTACKRVGFKWRPALREKRWRTPDEMSNYYANEIDLYIDLWQFSGRQNGILEAAACGVPVVSCAKGIAPELSKHGLVLCQRNVKSVCAALLKANRNNWALGKQLQRHVLKEWNWKLHTEYWERIFEQVVSE